MNRRIFLVSRCAWTLYNFRAGMIRALKNNGNTVIGAGASGDGFEGRIESLGIPFVGLPVDKKGINPHADLKLLYTLYVWYRKERPDIVHHFTIKPVIYGSIAARLAKIPRIINTITGLGYVFTGEEVTWLQRLVVWMYRVSIRCASFTFFQNPDDLKFFLRHNVVKRSRAGLLPGSGVNCRFFTPTYNSENNGGGTTILMMARLLRDKGVYEFVHAARLVKYLFPNVQFQLLGAPDERNPTAVPKKDLERWQLEGVVNWLGEVTDVRSVVASADMVVLPSYYREGTPRCLLEAAAMGKPIITTDAAGCREVVDEEVSGLLVPVKDGKKLAQAMIRLIQNPEMRRTMGKAGRKKVEREFDERFVIKKVLSIYKEKNL